MQSVELLETAPTICIRHAYKKFQENIVFDNLNITISKGSIYALLGASGCGKTTLLNCIVGLQKIDSGSIWVLGGYPNSIESKVPGLEVGYMPQHLSLNLEFSTIETMKYFGWLSHMTSREIEERCEFLLNLLQLADVNKKIKDLSGGEQRRASFAVALLHQPELLILDEPTIGVDALLRDSIWKHLIRLASENTTILITTHYIEEAHRATQIGLLRGGCLIATGAPQSILNQLQVFTLEEAFFQLSNLQEDGQITHDNSSEELLPLCDKEQQTKSSIKFSLNHLKPLIWKNLLWMYKNLLIMFSILILPAITMGFFWLCFGHRPFSLDVAVVNHELCNNSQLSCAFLEDLSKRQINLIEYVTDAEANGAVLKGKVYASITIKNNYTEAIKARLAKKADSSPWDLIYSTIDILYDPSIKDIGYYLQSYAKDALLKSLGDYYESCNKTRRAVYPPFKWNDPIYGKVDNEFTENSGIGAVVVVLFSITASLMGAAVIFERNEGVLERSLVLGVNRLEFFVAHILTQFPIVLIQSVFCLIVLSLLFDVVLNGLIGLFVVLLFEIGFCGMCTGFLLASICRTEKIFAYAVIGISNSFFLYRA